MLRNQAGRPIWRGPDRLCALLVAGALVAPTTGVLGASQEERITELERQVELLSREAERERFSDLFVEVDESKYGLGPAASKVYAKSEGLSIGGYGEMVYQNRDDGLDELDFLRAVLYFGYKFSPRWVFNSEIEIEHASTDEEGSVSVEFAYVDYLHADELNARVGLVLIPVGIVNELHEPTAFLSAVRPTVERVVIPTTWREGGIGLFGDVGPVSYRTYVVNGFKGEDFSDGGLRGGRQKGSKALAESFAWVGRLDWTITPGLVAGGSVYAGDAGQDLPVDIPTALYEAHVIWTWRGLDVRALGVVADVGDAEGLNAIRRADLEEGASVDSVGEKLWGWYAQVGYDVLNAFETAEHQLTPYVRLEQVDTQDEVPTGEIASGKNALDILTVGLNYKPLDQLVFKGEWQRFEDDAGGESDRVNLAMGYVF